MLRLGFSLFCIVALLGDFIANERPLYCKIQGESQFPAFRQKAVEWHLAKADSSQSSRNWLIFNNYESVIKAPIPFSSSSVDSKNSNFVAPFQSVHLLGTDRLGRDVFAGLIHGCKVAFWIGFGVALLATLIGTLLGSIAGFFNGITDRIILKIIEIKRTIPSLFWILALTAVLGKCSVAYIVLIIGSLGWTSIAQLMRASILKIKTEDYIIGAKTLGLNKWQIFLRHIIPNSLSPLYVSTPIIAAEAIFAEATLSFLGIGLPIEEVTWGALLRQGQSDITAWWLIVFPGFCIFLVIKLFNNLGEKWRKE